MSREGSRKLLKSKDSSVPKLSRSLAPEYKFNAGNSVFEFDHRNVYNAKYDCNALKRLGCNDYFPNANNYQDFNKVTNISKLKPDNSFINDANLKPKKSINNFRKINNLTQSSGQNMYKKSDIKTLLSKNGESIKLKPILKSRGGEPEFTCKMYKIGEKDSIELIDKAMRVNKNRTSFFNNI